MALPLRGQWDVTEVAKKYPWLRADQKAIEEFRSPFHWVDDSPRSPTQPNEQASDTHTLHHKKRARVQAKTQGELRAKHVKARRKQAKTSIRNHEELILQALNSSASDVQGVDNPPSDEEVEEPLLHLPSKEEDAPMLLSTPTVMVLPTPQDLDRIETPMLEFCRHDHEELVRLRNQKKKKKKAKKRKGPPSVLSLRFPALTSKPSPSLHNAHWMKQPKDFTPRTLLDKYSQELAHLAEEEHRIEQGVIARITEEKARLPLTFLFERNLINRSEAQQDGLRIVTGIFAKLQHRLLYAGFAHWREFLEAARHEERQREGLHIAKMRAVALLERVSSDAYVGTLSGSFQRWKHTIHMIVEGERHLAARVIQVGFRAWRSRIHLEALRQAAKALDYRRNQVIQALQRFERYGTTMRWSTLRIGFDFAKQNRAARNLQLFVRRVAVRRRIAHRVLRREGAIAIQAQWRARLARQEIERRRIERAIRFAFETKMAIQMQRAARGFLARNEAIRRRQWLTKAIPNAKKLQLWMRHRLSLAKLHARFRERKRMIDRARARADAKELARLNWRSAIAVQCVFRRLLARRIYERRLQTHQREQSAIYLQRFWRRRCGLYALALRFAERRERIAQCRLQAAITLQCAYRSFCARREFSGLAAEKERQQQAATVIQRRARGMIARKYYRAARHAVLVIQCSIRCAIARRRRSRRSEAVQTIQVWIRGVNMCREAHRMLCELRAEEKRRQASAVLIQKFVRQYEAQQVAQLFREALNVVKNEQRRYFGSEDGGIHGDKGWVTHQASSELLTYMTQRFLEDDCCFTTKETRWLRAQVQVAKERLAREDRAVVYLQRYYRGYATRLAFWVHRKQMDELQKLKSKKAVVIQCCARRWLARQRVRRLREQRRLAELKEAYIRERKRKEEERVWKERYDREQMELAVQSAQEAANQLREARREADLARVKAEAAEYRAQELAAEREIETLMNTAVTKKTDEAKDGDWEQFADEYGNVYYYNNRTGESSWDPPPVSSEKKSSDGAEDKDRQPEVKAEEPSKEIDPLEAILREGKCIKCRQALSTKRCLDCEDSGRAFYCNQCFKQEHAGSSEENSIGAKRNHDFEVDPEAAIVPARCESGMDCSMSKGDNSDGAEDQKTAARCLAAYYCYECIASPPSEVIADATSTDFTSKLNSDIANSSSPPKVADIQTTANVATTPGCFFCEECFARAHETAKQLRHLEKALRFRRGALLCCDCCHLLAIRQCEPCGDKFCEACFTSSHTGSKRRSETHVWKPLDVMRDLLERETDTYCVECDMRASSKLCNLCGDGFCDECFAKTHAKGAKSRHTWLPWNVAAQHGDWIEIKDGKSAIYFNVETKESTNERPAVLLSGEERHRLQLAEREQLQRSRQVELESEVVKLKEQLRELKAEDRPQSRVEAPAKKVDANQRPNSGATKTDKPEKRGVIGKIFGRNSSQRALTPEAKQTSALSAVITEKQSVGSVAFQQAMVQELAALPQPGSKPK